MDLLQIHRNVLKLFRSLSTPDAQGKYYDAQVAAIREISQYEGYRFIVQYREQQAEDAMRKLTNPKTPIEELGYWQARQNNAMEFLDFLENLAPKANL